MLEKIQSAHNAHSMKYLTYANTEIRAMMDDKEVSSAIQPIVVRWLRRSLSTDSVSQEERDYIAVAESVREQLLTALETFLPAPSRISPRDKAIQDGRDALAPSDAAKHSNLNSQQDAYPMDIGRPLQRLGLPVAIFHPIFSAFTKHLAQAQQVDLDLANALDPSALQLVLQSAEIYDTERDRITKLLPSLEQLIGMAVNPLLIPPVLLVNCPDPYGQARLVTEVFYALQISIKELNTFYSTLLDASIPEDPQVSFPYYKQSGDNHLTYTSSNLLSDRLGRAIFDAEMKTSSGATMEVKVKFTPRYYGREAHDLLAEHQLAPRLHVCEKLDDTWMVVVMDNIPSQTLAELSAERGPLPSQVFADIEQAMHLLHAQGLVFGDLRPPDILVYDRETENGKESRAMLVDFDWAGKGGIQRYPPALAKHRWPLGVIASGRIMADHKKEMMARIKKEFKYGP
ncbi:hypothetical protein FRB90_011567 [Tulasnella sp. 427]|nr:hypothetical protein FRB90_011567 [Tulasnella sp. 427]